MPQESRGLRVTGTLARLQIIYSSAEEDAIGFEVPNVQIYLKNTPSSS